MSTDIDMRCSVIVFLGEALLLVHRDGVGDWVLPGGTPRLGESMAACARREALEETGLAVNPARVAFIAETLGPGSPRRAVDLVFLAVPDAYRGRVLAEPGLDARFVPLAALAGLDLRPPLAGHLRGLHTRGGEPTAAYLGNLWHPQRYDGSGAVSVEAG